jgi:hypothetical protein
MYDIQEAPKWADKNKTNTSMKRDLESLGAQTQISDSSGFEEV